MELNQAFAEFLKEYRNGNFSENTKNQYRSNFKKLENYITSKSINDISDLTLEILTDYREFLGSENLGSSSFQQNVYFLRSFISYYANGSIIDDDCLDAFEIKKVTNRQLGETITDEIKPLKNLISKLEDPDLHLHFLLYSDLALKNTEIENLKYDNFDFENLKLTIKGRKKETMNITSDIARLVKLNYLLNARKKIFKFSSRGALRKKNKEILEIAHLGNLLLDFDTLNETIFINTAIEKFVQVGVSAATIALKLNISKTQNLEFKCEQYKKQFVA